VIERWADIQSNFKYQSVYLFYLEFNGHENLFNRKPPYYHVWLFYNVFSKITINV